MQARGKGRNSELCITHDFSIHGQVIQDYMYINSALDEGIIAEKVGFCGSGMLALCTRPIYIVYN